LVIEGLKITAKVLVPRWVESMFVCVIEETEFIGENNKDIYSLLVHIHDPLILSPKLFMTLP